MYLLWLFKICGLLYDNLMSWLLTTNIFFDSFLQSTREETEFLSELHECLAYSNSVKVRSMMDALTIHMKECCQCA